MTAIVKADQKGRILIRGTERGQRYVVTSQNGGWWIAPVQEIRAPKKRRDWKGSKMSLAQHLKGLAENGLRIKQVPHSRDTQPGGLPTATA